MATYAVGDVQGCYVELCQLLDKLAFGPTDKLWLAGDLVNRGPQSLEVLRLVRSLGPRVNTVLGNHDLHLLAIYFGGHKSHRTDTFDALLAAPDMDDIGHWYREQPLLIVDDSLGYAMAHAGVPHCWSLEQAQGLAAEVSQVLKSEHYQDYFRELYGNEPDCWRNDLTGMARWRLITNYFTRMRLIQADGRLDFRHKGALHDLPEGYAPWYRYWRADLTLLFGHWAALEGVTDNAQVVALDTGCVWGRSLTAVCLETHELTQVPAEA